MNIHIQVFVWTHVFNFLKYIPRSRITESYSNPMFNYLSNHQVVFHSDCNHFTFPPAMYNGSPNPHQHLLFSFFFLSFFLSFFFYWHPSGCEVVSHCGFDCISLMTNDDELHFMCLLAICISSFQKCLFNSFAHFIYLFFKFYLFLAASSLHCCAWAFSSHGERGLLFFPVRGLLIVVASLVAKHRLRPAGFSSCGTWAQ